MRSSILLTFQVKARNPPKDFQPYRGVASNLDLRLDRSERVERLVE
jgi:hypothetical protein